MVKADLERKTQQQTTDLIEAEKNRDKCDFKIAAIQEILHNYHMDLDL